MRETILVCSLHYPPDVVGGAELVAHEQAKALKRRGYRAIVFSGETNSNGDGRYSMREDSWEGVPVFRVKLRRKDIHSGYVNFFHPEVDAHFEELLARYRPSVVHTHNIGGLSARIPHLAKRAGARTVATLHDYWGFCFKNTRLKQPEEICRDHRRCSECMPYIHDGAERGIPIALRNDFLARQFDDVDAFISPSFHVGAAYARAGLPVGKLVVVPNGIDVDRFSRVRKRPGDRIRFSFVGYLGHHKGVAHLIQALPLLGDASRFRVNVVGDGELGGTLRKLAGELGMEENARFWGRVDNRVVDEVLAETDVLVLPSIWEENQPVSVSEALASRTPVIASRVGGIPEQVRDGVDGLLYDAESVEALAGRMREFIEHPEWIAEFGERALAGIEANTFDRYARRIARVYEDGRREEERGETLIACVGSRVDGVCAEAMEHLRRTMGARACRFAMAEWLTADQMAGAEGVWVVDGMVTMEARRHGLRHALRHGAPALVPSDFPEAGVGGVRGYSTALEAAERLKELLDHAASSRRSDCSLI